MRILIRFLFVLIAACALTSVSAQQITKKRGTVKIYHPNGKLKAKGKVKNYHRKGEWKYYDDEGRPKRTVNFMNDTVNGPYTEYYANGKVSSSGTYCMNKKCGNWIGWDENGLKISDENFSADKAHGIQRYWFAGGVLRDSMVLENGVMLYRQMWHASGVVKAIETYNNGLAEGTWKVYPEVPVDTFASTADDYHLGKKHGWHYAWNGASLIEAYHYADGLPDGPFMRYAYDGKLVLIQNYSKGMLNGNTTFFKDSMKLKEENYVNDVKEGEQIEYDRSGQPSKRSWYDAGFMDSMNIYHPNGKIAIHRLYGGTIGMSNYTEWDSSGVLLMKGMMHNELRYGEWTTYYPNGEVRSVTNYQDGKMVGLYTKYYPNGKKMIQYTFLPIGTNTMPDVWNEKGKMLKMGTKEYEEIVEGNKPGEMLSDPSGYNRSIIDHRIRESASVEETGEPLLFLTELPENNEDFLRERVTEEMDSGEVFSFCELMPEYPGGAAARSDFILKNFRYPQDAMEVDGTVYIEYIVERDGSVTNVKVVRGVAGFPSFGEEAVRVVSAFPAHTPAMMNGKTVRCRLAIPIRIEH